MKRSILALFLALFCAGNLYAGIYNSGVKVEFRYGTVRALTLVNKYGKIEINRVAEGSNIIVDVNINCTANSAADAQKIFEGMRVQHYQNGTSASVYFESSNDKALKKLFKGVEVTADYSVTLPEGIELNIICENGSVMVPDYGARVSIQATNSNVYLGEVSYEDAPTLISLKRGACVFKGSDAANLNIDNGSYELGNISNLNLVANNSYGTLEESTILNLDLTYGSLKVGSVEDVTGGAVDCKVTIGDIGDCLTLSVERESLKIDNVHFSFDKIMLTSVWADVDITFMKDSGFNINLQHDKHLKVDFPSDLKLGTLSASSKKMMVGAGYYGNTERRSDVRFRMTGGTLKLR